MGWSNYIYMYACAYRFSFFNLSVWFLATCMQVVLARPETVSCFSIFLELDHVYTHAHTEPNWEPSIPCHQSRAGIAVSITSAFVALFVKSTASSKTVD